MTKHKADETKSVPSDERPTLLTCESCAGAGLVDAEPNGAGSYRSVPCMWCDCVGYYNRGRQDAYRRWKRIKAHHVARGLCG